MTHSTFLLLDYFNSNHQSEDYSFVSDVNSTYFGCAEYKEFSGYWLYYYLVDDDYPNCPIPCTDAIVTDDSKILLWKLE